MISYFGRIAPVLLFWTIGLGIVALALFGEPSYSDRAQRLIEIFFSWPTIVGVIVFLFLLRHQAEIATYLKYLSIKLPSGAVISAQEIATIGTERAKTATNIELTDEQKAQIQKELEVVKSAKEGEINSLRELLVQRQQLSVFWWFEFLNATLMPLSKVILEWIYNRSMQLALEAAPPPITVASYREYWSKAFPNEVTRDVALSALYSAGLVQEDPDGSIRPTDVGKQFLAHQRAKLRVQ